MSLGKILKHLVAIVVGIVAYVIVGVIICILIELLARIPILGSILYYPTDSSWALTVLPYITATQITTMLSTKICGTAKPVSIILAAYWIFYILFLFVVDAFTLSALIRVLFPLGACIFAFLESETDATPKTRATISAKDYGNAQSNKQSDYVNKREVLSEALDEILKEPEDRNELCDEKKEVVSRYLDEWLENARREQAMKRNEQPTDDGRD